MTDTQATFAATLVDEWVRAGVTHAVVCPGSRSTPLALALAADGRLRLEVVVDERSAGFVALGVGKAGAAPAVVLTTSGTAAAELHPAVMEASLAGVPLLVCTADRPPELRDVGAPQTVDQTHLYGRAVRWFAEPGVADAATAASWRSLAARAVAEATGSAPGPVHLNLSFRDPLVGDPGPLPEGRADGAPWHRVPGSVPDPGALDGVADLLRSPRGVVVAGAGGAGADAYLALWEATGWPVLADPPSGARVPARWSVAHADALLRHEPFASSHRPGVVVRVGDLPASKVLAGWLAASGAPQVVLHRHGRWLDPDRTAAAVVAGDPSALVQDLARRLRAPVDRGWGRSWTGADGLAAAAIEAGLAGRDELTEPGIARTVARALPDGATLVVASSMPVRDLEWYAAPRPGLRVLANRGANGIDGVVSTAVGVALTTGAPTVALVGDLAFLHDTGALLGLAERDLDLTVVVVDNRGGGIFSFLSQAGAVPSARFEQLFGTPHGVDLASLAAVHGVGALWAHAADGLRPALDAALASPGPHVVVAGTDRAANVGVHDQLHAAVAAALR